MAPTILFIEDDLAIAEMYRLRLQLEGFKVEIATEGKAGLAAARKLRPDLIFLDLRLPGMDGLAILENLQRDPQTADLRVVILSAYNEFDNGPEAERLGAMAYLTKTEVTPTGLVRQVHQWLAPNRN